MTSQPNARMKGIPACTFLAMLLFLAAVSLPAQEGRKLIRISSYSGKEEPFGREMDWLAPGAGILFRVE